MNTFDFIDAQHRARQMSSARELLRLWEDSSCRYVRREIGKYELDELKDTVWDQFRLLRALKKLVTDRARDAFCKAE